MRRVRSRANDQAPAIATGTSNSADCAISSKGPIGPCATGRILAKRDTRVASVKSRRQVQRALTPRQVQVLDLLGHGHRTREIARALRISERAVTAHVTRLMTSFGVPNRTGLIAAAMASSGQPQVARLDEEEFDRYEDAPFLVAVTSGPTHVFRFVNKMWEKVMRLRSRDVIGRTVREVFPDASAVTYSARQRAFREARRTTGDAWHFKWTSADGSAREADFRYIYQPLCNVTGQAEGLLLIATEKSEK
jgi:DNA-binding CsgD family transcriptional regulator